MLALQGHVGNRAVANMLDRAGTRPTDTARMARTPIDPPPPPTAKPATEEAGDDVRMPPVHRPDRPEVTDTVQATTRPPVTGAPAIDTAEAPPEAEPLRVEDDAAGDQQHASATERGERAQPGAADRRPAIPAVESSDQAAIEQEPDAGTEVDAVVATQVEGRVDVAPVEDGAPTPGRLEPAVGPAPPAEGVTPPGEGSAPPTGAPSAGAPRQGDATAPAVDGGAPPRKFAVGSRSDAVAALQAPPAPVPARQPLPHDPGVSRWQAAARGATGAIAEPDLTPVRDAPDRLRQRSDARSADRRRQRGDIPAEARAALPEPPQVDDPPEPAPPDPVPAATALIEAEAAKRLPEQSLPEPTRSPDVADDAYGVRLPGLHPGQRPAAPAPPEPVALHRGPGEAQGRDPRMGQVAARSGEPPTSQATSQAPPEPITLTDDGPPSAEPGLPEGMEADMAQVLATLVVGADATVEAWVDQAMQAAFPNATLKRVAPELGDEATPQLQAELKRELDGIREAAGIEAEELAAKVTEARARVEAAGDSASQDLEAARQAATASTEQRAQEEQAAITGAAIANDDAIAAKQAEATGEVDPEHIERRSRRLEDEVRADAGKVRAHQRLAKEQREQQLESAQSTAVTGYTTTAQAQAQAVRAAYQRALPPGTEAGTPSGEADEEARRQAMARALLPTMQWQRAGEQAIRRNIAEHKLAVVRTSREMATALDAAQDAAVQAVRTWRDEQLGIERSWWQNLLDLFRDWTQGAEASNAAWEQARNLQSRDSAVADLEMLADLRHDIATGNRKAIAAAGEGLDASQRVVLQTFFQTGGNAVAAVAAGMSTRIGQRRIPELLDQLRAKAEALGDLEKLQPLGAAQTPGFNALSDAQNVRRGVSGWGTEEERVYGALGGKTKIQAEAIRAAYAFLYPGSDIEDDLTSDLSGAEEDRALQMLEGDTLGAEVAELRAAVEGWGTDEAAIMRVLRNKSPEEAAEIRRRYEEIYDVTLDEDLQSDLGANDEARAQALLSGDTARADAIALQEAMEGAGTDEGDVHAVFATIRSDVEAEGATLGLTSEQIEERIRQRNREVSEQYGIRTEAGTGALEASLEDEFSAAELDLAQAYLAGNTTAIDAATIRVEEESFYASDSVMLEALENQRRRAEADVRRDLTVELQAELMAMSPEERREHGEAMKARLESRIRSESERRTNENMAALEQLYDDEYGRWGPGSLQVAIAFNMGGRERDKAMALANEGGYLTEAQELDFAIRGTGTDEDTIKRLLRDPADPSRLRSKDEVERIRREYRQLTGRDLDVDLSEDLSGRDAVDVGDMMLGEATSPEERLRRLDARVAFERGEEFGLDDAALGALFPLYGAAKGLGTIMAAEEARVMGTTSHGAHEAYAEYQALLAQGVARTDPRVVAAKERFNVYVGATDTAIESHRAAIDSAADTISTVAAIAAGVAVSVATAGAGAPLVIAAAAGSAAGTAATVVTKAAVKGNAYSVEELGADLAVGGVDMVAAMATAGVGNYLLRSSALSRLADAGVLGQVSRQLVFEGVEGGLGGVPSAMVGAMLNDATWQAANPLEVILLAGGQGLATGFATSAGMSGAGKAYAGATRTGAAPPDVPVGASAAPPAPGPEVQLGSNDLPPPDVDIAPAGRGEDALTQAAVDRGAPVRPTELPPEMRSPEPPGGTPTANQAQPDPSKPLDDVLDLDAPENLHLQEGIVGALPDDIATDTVAARDFYEGFVTQNPGMESALLRNVETGEHLVVQGGPDSVDFSKMAADWRELVPPAKRGQGRWVVESHSHPVDPTTGFTPEWARLPSGGGADFYGVAVEARERGGAVTEDIRITTERGADITRFGYDPQARQPYHVDFPGSDGSRQVRRFATIEAYHRWYQSNFGGDLGPIPDDFPGTRDPGAGSGTDAGGTTRGDDPTSQAPTEVPPNPRAPTRPAPPPTPLPPKLEELAREHPELLTPTKLQANRQANETHARRVLAAYEQGVTPDGDPVRPWAGLADEMESFRRELEELAPLPADPRAALLANAELQQRVDRAGEVLRSGGELFIGGVDRDLIPTGGQPQADRIRSSAAALDLARTSDAELTAALDFGTPEAWAAGVLGEPLARDLPGVGLETYVLTPSGIGKLKTEPPELARRLEALVAGYQRAHLVGPGFGDELYAGIMLAPAAFNLRVQNGAIEAFLRRAADAGFDVDISAFATGRRLAVPLKGGDFEHIDILESVTYVIHDADGNTRHIELVLDPPPDGGWEVRRNDVPGLDIPES